jgi:hypothetical protein
MPKIKLLAIHSIGWLGEDKSAESAVDHWRIYRPLRELKKHTDWEITEQPTFIKGIEKYKDKTEFTEEEFEKAAEYLGQFDVVWSSYFPDSTPYLLMKVVHERYGTKLVLDTDDDLFHVNPDNPFWTKVGHKEVWHMQNIIKDVDYITTTTERLADVFRDRRDQDIETVKVLPNYMPDDYQHPPFDNSPNVVIGYFGGASHFSDLNLTHVTKAIKRLMRKDRNLHFKTINMPMAMNTPVARTHFEDGKRGEKWVTEVFPTLKMDICIIPVIDNIFNQGKSNIKWMESTRMGAATVCSNVGPYADLPDGVTLKVSNHYYPWLHALEKLIYDVEFRKQQVKNAQQELEQWRLEDHWQEYKTFFEEVAQS